MNIRTNNFKYAIVFMAFSFTLPNLFAQDYLKVPQGNERVLESISGTDISRRYTDGTRIDVSDGDIYNYELKKAKEKYPSKIVDIRDLKVSRGQEYLFTDGGSYKIYDRKISYSAKIVEFVSPETKFNETIVLSLNKALGNIRSGSRIAIEQVTITGSNLSRDAIKDQVVDILLETGYRVVAVEFLERLRNEQEQQRSGGYNERTLAQTDNISGTGYFLTVRVNEKSIRIQIIDVSTGEYVGNATVDF